MKIYLDLILFLNFFFDFILLFAVDRLLHKKAKIKRLFLGAIIGSLSILFLFLSLNSFTLFLLKLIISTLMILVTFGFKNINTFLKTTGYLYLVSIILGGALYLININMSYKNEGIVFLNNGLSINLILIIILTPIIIYLYVKDNKNYKNTFSNIYDVRVIYKNKEYILKGYLDTGNHLKDPYKRRSVLLIDNKKINIKEEDIIYVPYNALNHNGLIKCTKVDKVIINEKEYTNMLIGLSKDKFRIEDVDCIIPSVIKEDMND